MTTLDSSSEAESSMDNNGSTGHHLQILPKVNSFNTATTTHNNLNSRAAADGGFGEEYDDEGGEHFPEEGGGGEVWRSFTENFLQVQSVLDRNRVLIQQVNENHQSKIHSNMVKNVSLIQEINGNISKVVSLYSNLSANFSGMFHERNGEVDAKSDNDKGDTVQD